MKTSQIPLLVELLTAEGKQILTRALENKFILYADVGRMIKPKIAKDARRAATTVATLTTFLRDNQISSLLKAPSQVTPQPHANGVASHNGTAKVWIEKHALPNCEKRNGHRTHQNGDGDHETVTKSSSGFGSGATSEELTFLRYMREVSAVPLLTPALEKQLAYQKKHGATEAIRRDAREQMITANLRLVVKIAGDYRGFGVSVIDLIQEGNIGLMKAIERFQLGKGAKISTYASWWIKQSIKRALSNQAGAVRLPVHVHDKKFQIARLIKFFHNEYGREPTTAEIAQHLGFAEKQVKRMQRVGRGSSPLDAPIGENEETFGEIFADENAIPPDLASSEDERYKILQDLVAELPPRLATIIRLRFGTDGGEPETLEEVGKKFGVTRERIRQIQNIALKRLRGWLDNADEIHIDEDCNESDEL